MSWNRMDMVYIVSSIRQQSGCEFKIGMMVCCVDAEYVSL